MTHHIRLLTAVLTAGLLLGGPAVPTFAASKAKPATGEEAKASRDKKRKALGKTGDPKKKAEKASESEEKEKTDDDLFLAETRENQTWLPDLYRCPECGYEQDETGTCPDHLETALVLVRAEGKNPLEPPEVDGNEDLIVDMPVTGLVFKKAAPASGTAPVSPSSSGPGTPSSPGMQPPPTKN